MSGIDIRQIDERWILDNADRLWDWLGAEQQRAKLAADREARAEERHQELIAAISDSSTAIVKALSDGFRMLAGVLPR